MQSIERYGVVALCFLIVTMVAVWAWDDQVTQAGDTALVQTAEAGAGIPSGSDAPRPGAREKEPREGLGGARSGGSVATPARFAREPETRSEGGGAGLRTSREVTLDEAARNAIVSSRTGALTPEILRARRQEAARVEAERKEAEHRARQQAWESEQRELQAAGNGRGAGDPANRPEDGPLLAAEERGEPAAKSSVTRTRESERRNSGGLRTYVIGPGDTLSEIAMVELGTMHRMDEVLAVNPGLNPERLPVGVEILLPKGQAVVSHNAKGPSVMHEKGAPVGEGNRHVVGSGESLWLIAQRALGDGSRWEEIARLNPSIDPQRLVVGQVLVMPGDTSAPSRGRAAPRVAKREQVRSRARGKVL